MSLILYSVVVVVVVVVVVIVVAAMGSYGLVWRRREVATNKIRASQELYSEHRCQ
jgi:ABC-type glycerol-3-phosphate transport system permease component